MLYADYVYEDEFRHRRTPPYDEYYIVKTIRQSIDTADKENFLRPDAKYFLIVNFHHLIVRPLFEQREKPFSDFFSKVFGSEKDFFIELENNIQSDIATIVSETKKEVYNQRDISGHQIMRTIDRIWQNLKTTRFELWG